MFKLNFETFITHVIYLLFTECGGAVVRASALGSKDCEFLGSKDCEFLGSKDCEFDSHWFSTLATLGKLVT